VRPNPHRTLGARLLISAALNCCTPLLADSAIHAAAQQCTGRIGQPGWYESAARRQVGKPVIARSGALDSSEPCFVRARACLFALLQEGYDSQLPDFWLEALGEDTISEGMPGELWSIVRRPDRADQIVIMSGKIVHVGA
jgi:hypothetical protein